MVVLDFPYQYVAFYSGQHGNGTPKREFGKVLLCTCDAEGVVWLHLEQARAEWSVGRFPLHMAREALPAEIEKYLADREASEAELSAKEGVK